MNAEFHINSNVIETERLLLRTFRQEDLDYFYEYASVHTHPGRDISFMTDEGKFNYRVCGLILRDAKILAMRDEVSPYYYLPGGRVKIGETAEEAMIREIREELNIPARLSRPLWLSQAFFTEDVSGTLFHELCFYYLLETDRDALPDEPFTLTEGPHTHNFEWLPFEQLEQEYFYPAFLKKEIFHLPDQLTLRTDIE